MTSKKDEGSKSTMISGAMGGSGKTDSQNDKEKSNSYYFIFI